MIINSESAPWYFQTFRWRSEGLCSRRRAVAVLALLTVSLLSTPSWAFCRQTTCIESDCGNGASLDCVEKSCERDDDGCLAEGVELSYSHSCLSFAVEKGAGKPLDLSDRQFEKLVAHAFESWEQLDCGGGETPGFHMVSSGVVPTTGNFTCPEFPESNLSVWRFSPPCDQEMKEDCWIYGERSLGFTTSRFGTVSGEIFDADVELNLGQIEEQFSDDELQAVLLKIAIHEAGHFLGLAHSDNNDAVMATSYGEGTLLSREFDQDDIRGICTIYPPLGEQISCGAVGVAEVALNQEACDSAGEKSELGGCTLGVGGSPNGVGWWVGLALGVLYLKRRRSSFFGV